MNDPNKTWNTVLNIVLGIKSTKLHPNWQFKTPPLSTHAVDKFKWFQLMCPYKEFFPTSVPFNSSSVQASFWQDCEFRYSVLVFSFLTHVNLYSVIPLSSDQSANTGMVMSTRPCFHLDLFGYKPFIEQYPKKWFLNSLQWNVLYWTK